VVVSLSPRGPWPHGRGASRSMVQILVGSGIIRPRSNALLPFAGLDVPMPVHHLSDEEWQGYQGHSVCALNLLHMLITDACA
jgi:hypothetical protein